MSNPKSNITNGEGKKRVLLLGMSYPELNRIIEKNAELRNCVVDGVIDVAFVATCVHRKYLTQIDGRDLVRILEMKRMFGMDVFTVSLEKSATYRRDCHLHADFNNRCFIGEVKNAFGEDIVFDEIILDYFWIPRGWSDTHWRPTFFAATLFRFAKTGLLGPSGRIFLPFCLTCYREMVAVYENVLKRHYRISFVRKDEMASIALWTGTQQVDRTVMRTIFGKSLEQEETYCTLSHADLRSCMEDSRATNQMLLQFAKDHIVGCIEDIRFIRLDRFK